MVALFSTTLLVAGCSSSSGTVSTVSPTEFSQVVAKPGTQVVDVRTPAEYATGHLDGAVNIDVESVRLATVSGMLVDSDGLPVANSRIMVIQERQGASPDAQ